jgi:hypothetical protein
MRAPRQESNTGAVASTEALSEFYTRFWSLLLRFSSEPYLFRSVDDWLVFDSSSMAAQIVYNCHGGNRGH